MKKYILTRKAEEDIRDIWKYKVEEWDEEQAEIYLSSLEEKIKQASENPETVGRLRADLKQGYKSFLYESHVVFFKKRANHIEVIRGWIFQSD